MPADTSVYVAIFLEGRASHNGAELRPGDALAFGLSAVPLVGESDGAELLIADLSFPLFYRLTGRLPLICGEVTKLEADDPFSRLAGILLDLPPVQRVEAADRFLRAEEAVSRLPCGLRVVERLSDSAALVLSSRAECFSEIACHTGVSYRQFERDFRSALGMTPIEYERIVRFYRALRQLRRFCAAEAALRSGYSDQAHMNREFKRLCAWTPVQSRDQARLLLNGGYLADRR